MLELILALFEILDISFRTKYKLLFISLIYKLLEIKEEIYILITYYINSIYLLYKTI